jgi:hypothetical protein
MIAWEQFPDPNYWEKLFKKVGESEFLTGGGPKGWRADLDCVLISENRDKILSGRYSDHQPKEDSEAQIARVAKRMEEKYAGRTEKSSH